MQMQKMVLVENKFNGVQAKMTAANFEMNQIKWRLIGRYDNEGNLVSENGASVQEEVKKKEVVSPAVNETKEETPFVKIEEEPAMLGGGLLVSMREEYEKATGKKADGRWNMARLQKEIQALNPVV